MSNPMGKALTTVFVLGVVVSFSSLLFLVVFYNFSVLPTIPVIISVLVCACFQLAAYLGGVVFQKRIWPAILCILVCSVGTAWAGAVGPGTLFGMPGALLANADKTFSNPLYLASMPVTIVGFGAGIAYFVLGVSSLLYDSHLINKERAHVDASLVKQAGKAAIYSHVTDMLRVADEPEVDVQEATLPVAAEAGEPAETVVEEEAELAEVVPEDDDEPAEEQEGIIGDSTREEEIPDKDAEAANDSDEDEPQPEATGEISTTGADTDKESLEPPTELSEPEPIVSAPAPAGSVFSRMTAKIATFLAVEQPDDTEEQPELTVADETETPIDVSEAKEVPEPEAEPPSGEPMEGEASTEDTEIIAESDDEAAEGIERAEMPTDSTDHNDPDEGDEPESTDKPSDPGTEEEPSPVETTLEENEPDETDTSDENSEGYADTPADDIDNLTPIEETTDVEKADDVPDSTEPLSFLALRRSELLSGWADTPCTPIPLEDVAVTLETDRLRILRLDKQAFSALLQGIEEMETATGLTPSGEQLDSHTLDTFDSLYAYALEDPQNYKWFAVWIIASRAENKLLGSAGFKGQPDGDGEVELGCGVNETRRGSNYAGEAAVALCQWALLQQDVRAVTAQTDLASMGSESLVEKAGLKRVKETSTSCFWRLEK